MAGSVEIRQAIFDWQGPAKSITLNVLRTSSDGDVSGAMATFTGPAVTTLVEQVEAAILARASARFPNRQVGFSSPPPAEAL